MGIAKFVQRIFSVPSRLLSIIAYRNTIVVFRKSCVTASSRHDFRIQEYSSGVRAVLDVYKSVGRYNYYEGADDDARMEARVKNGMRFFAAIQNNEVIAYLWMHSTSDRFFDEIGLFLAKGADNLWLRDMYVTPRHRGQRLFVNTLNAVICQYFPDCRYLYSDVDHDNSPSLRAHQHLGMEEIGKVSYARICGAWLYRKIEPEFLPQSGFRYPQHFLRLDRHFKSYVQRHLC